MSLSLPTTSKGGKKLPPLRKRSKGKNKGSSGFFGWLFSWALNIGALYTIWAALVTCSSRPLSFDFSSKDPHPICRSLAHGKAHLIPLATPVIKAAHQKVDPYTGPYIRAATPYANAAYKTAKPHYDRAHKHGKVLYKKHVDPARKHAVKKGKAYLDPHVKTARKEYKKRVQPHVDTFHRSVKPYRDVYHRDVAPYVSQANVLAVAAGATSYTFYVKEVHPRLIVLLRQLQAFYINQADPAMRHTYSAFIRPQLEKMYARLFNRKARAVSSEAVHETKEAIKEAAQRAEQSLGDNAEKVTEGEPIKAAAEKVEDFVSSTFGSDDSDEAESSDEDSGDDPETLARLDAELDAELESVKSQLGAWETGLTRLIYDEYKLYTERIAELRNGRIADLPDHFDSIVTTSKDQAASILEKLAKAYKDLGSASDDAEEGATAERSLRVQSLAEGPFKKLQKVQQSSTKAISDWGQSLEDEEAKARKASVAAIREYLKEAKQAYKTILEEAKFERSVEDFSGWDKGLGVRVNLLDQELEDLRLGKETLREGIGATDLRNLPDVKQHLAQLQKDSEKLFKGAFSQIKGYGSDSPLSDIGSAVDSLQGQATELANNAAQSMLDVALAAREKLGLGARPTPGILERIQTSANAAASSAAESVQSATSPVESAVSSASESAASVVQSDGPNGFSAAIEEVKETAGSIRDAAQDAATAALQGAGSLAAKATAVVEGAVEDEDEPGEEIEDGDVEPPTFSILPIEVVDDKGTPANSHAGAPKHEEL